MMAISKDRLEKELAAQKYRVAKIEAEVLAQKKKAEAIAHLESQGQRVQGVEGFSKKVAAKTADNTLALLLGRKAITTANEGEKIKEQIVKAALIRQQEEIRRSRDPILDKDDLPPNWESVLDDHSKLFYYWNRITNVTTWEKPGPSEGDNVKILPTESEVSSSVTIHENLPKTSSLLPGWEEKTHSATQQSYYVNIISGETSSVKPTVESHNMQSSESEILDKHTSENKKRPSTSSSSGDQSKFQQRSIDPLDVSDVD
jgi:WW domain